MIGLACLYKATVILNVREQLKAEDIDISGLRRRGETNDSFARAEGPGYGIARIRVDWQRNFSGLCRDQVRRPSADAPTGARSTCSN